MRILIILACICLASLPTRAIATEMPDALILALNPQPEPPSRPKLRPTKKQSAPQQLRQQDLRGLNPQPEPPSRPRGTR